METPTADRETILRAIEAWPLEEQVELAQVILHRATTHGAVAPQRPSWRQMAGLGSSGRVAPSDEDVARWLDERRLEKYG